MNTVLIPKILLSTDDFYIIFKPPNYTVSIGMGVEENKKEATRTNSIVKFIIDNCDQRMDIVYDYGIAHRLDRNTSGMLLVAKNIAMFHYIRKTMFPEKKIKKTYLCLVHGRVEQCNGFITTPIACEKITNSNTFLKCYPSEFKGKYAFTIYQVLRYYEYEGKEFSLMEIQIITGRTHQIRIHMKHIGHPLVSDFQYCKENIDDDLLFCPRIFLHAYKLKFLSKDKILYSLTLDLPKDLKKVLKTLHKKDKCIEKIKNIELKYD